MGETHSIKNVRKDHPAMLAEIVAVAQIARDAGIHFAVSLSTAFGCTLEGAAVMRLAEALLAAGAQEFSLSDTPGYVDPAQVKRLVRKVSSVVGNKLTTLHLHNTRGLGGCPYAPGASGNLVIEDLVLMLNAMGLDTGIYLEKPLAMRPILAAALPDEPLYGFTPDAGPILDYQEGSRSERAPTTRRHQDHRVYPHGLGASGGPYPCRAWHRCRADRTHRW